MLDTGCRRWLALSAPVGATGRSGSVSQAGLTIERASMPEQFTIWWAFEILAVAHALWQYRAEVARICFNLQGRNRRRSRRESGWKTTRQTGGIVGDFTIKTRN